MTIHASEPVVPFWYTPESEKDNDNPTRFHLKPLNGVEMFEVRSKIKFDADGQLVTTADCARTVLRAGLLGWENFLASAGAVEFDIANRDSNIARIPFAMVSELFSELIKRSTLSETVRKN